MQLEPLYQIGDADVQGIGDDLQRSNGGVALASLYLANVRSLQAGFIGENILGPAALQAQRLNRRSELLLDVLHQGQFRGILVLSILVITREGDRLSAINPLGGPMDEKE
jgi:hypothetical protein